MKPIHCFVAFVLFAALSFPAPAAQNRAARDTADWVRENIHDLVGKEVALNVTFICVGNVNGAATVITFMTCDAEDGFGGSIDALVPNAELKLYVRKFGTSAVGRQFKRVHATVGLSEFGGAYLKLPPIDS